MSPVISDDAEASVRLLYQALALHQSLLRNIQRNERRRIPTAGADAVQLQRQSTLLRLVTITELFCSRNLLAGVEAILEPSRHETVQKIWGDAARGATSNWESIEKSYKKWLDVTLDAGAWTAVRDYAEARNAVAHGYGVLTHMQRRSLSKVRPALVRVNIALDERSWRITLSDRVLHEAVEACREFIEHLDDKLQQRK